ncbi:MAG: DNA adenine methylase [Chloroflexi bacterium]|nr:DNA adenine methylase [Chloroflexota bacterium]
MSVPHPIPYQGSKRSIAKFILPFFPPNDLSVRLIEPFAGSAAISLAATHYCKAQTVVLNDVNSALMSLWDEILLRPNVLADRYEELWNAQLGREREYYNLIRERFNRSPSPECFLYLLARCVKASIRYNSNGEFNQSPDNRRKGANPTTMRRHLIGASLLLSGRTTVSCADYRDVLDGVLSSDIVYMDPPYQGVCNDRDPRYVEGIDRDEFVETLQNLNQREISYVVSYDGRSDEKSYGEELPEHLDLKRLEIDAGRSSQGTLLGRATKTFESLYLSSALLDRIDVIASGQQQVVSKQLSLSGSSDVRTQLP